MYPAAYLVGFLSALLVLYGVVRFIWWYDTRQAQWEGL